MNMKKTLRVALVVGLLAGCNDSTLETVKTLPASANDKTALGTMLDRRPVCDKTTWTETAVSEKGGDARVYYHCDLSAIQTRVLFDTQMNAWKDRYQRRLAESEVLRAEVLERRSQASPALLDAAYPLFEQLQASGDLARYKALVKGSPVHNQPLEAVNAFFIGAEGSAWLDMTQGAEAPAAQAALDAVTQAVTASGLATTSQDIDVCTAPALLVLAVILTPEEVETGFNECRTSLTSRYEAELASADEQIAAAHQRLETLGKPLTLLSVTEVITWTVPAKGAPAMHAHAVELSVKDGEQIHRITKALGLTDNDMAGVVTGDYNRLYQDAQVSAMSDLFR